MRGRMGGKGGESGDEGGWDGRSAGTQKDVREINHQRNERFLSSFTYCIRRSGSQPLGGNQYVLPD